QARRIMSRLCFLLPLLAGCIYETPVQYTPINHRPHPMPFRAPESVEVLTTVAPSRPHIDVGLLEIEQGVQEDTPQMVARLRERAAATGCDAIVVMNLGHSASGIRGSTSSRKTIAAT